MSIILVLLSLRNHVFSFFILFVFRTFFSKSFYGPIYSFFFTNLRLQLENSFFLNFNYCFLFLVLYCLETCVNCVANCVTQKFTPLRSEFYKLFFSMSFYGQLRQLFHISEPTLSKQFFLNLTFCLF